MNRLAYHRPRSLAEALRLVQTAAEARFIAGGTDLQLHKLGGIDSLVSLRWIPELAGIVAGPCTRIGSMTLVRDIHEDASLGARFPVLVEAAGRLGSAQIRNVATVGGNLCRAAPCADLAPPLLVHEARVRIRGPQVSREVALEEFFAGPGETCLDGGELLTDILLDEPDPGARACFLKKGRVCMDLALASVAVLLVMDGSVCRKARVAAGSVAPTPLRLTGVETLLAGREITPAVAADARDAAAAAVEPISDIRASRSYRRQITGVYVERAIGRLLGWNGR